MRPLEVYAGSVTYIYSGIISCNNYSAINLNCGGSVFIGSANSTSDEYPYIFSSDHGAGAITSSAGLEVNDLFLFVYSGKVEGKNGCAIQAEGNVQIGHENAIGASYPLILSNKYTYAIDNSYYTNPNAKGKFWFYGGRLCGINSVQGPAGYNTVNPTIPSGWSIYRQSGQAYLTK